MPYYVWDLKGGPHLEDYLLPQLGFEGLDVPFASSVYIELFSFWKVEVEGF